MSNVTRVLLFGGEDRHREELVAYEKEYGFKIVRHFKCRTKVAALAPKGSFDKVASMVVFQSHYLSRIASNAAKACGVSLVILGFGAKMNAMKIAGIDEAKEEAAPAPTNDVTLKQGEALKYLQLPYHKGLSVLRSDMVYRQQTKKSVLYSRNNLDQVLKKLAASPELLPALPEPYPRAGYPKPRARLPDISFDAPPFSVGVAPRKEEPPAEEKKVEEKPVEAAIHAAGAKYLLLVQSAAGGYMVVPFDNALLKGSTDDNDLLEAIALSAETHALPSKSVLLLVQPILRTEVARQVTLRKIPV